MDPTAWTVVGAAIAILVAIGASFRSMRQEMKELRGRIDAQGEDLRDRMDAQGEDLRDRMDAQGQEMRKEMGQLRDRVEAQGQEMREEMSQMRERMARLEGLLAGLREAITRRAA